MIAADQLSHKLYPREYWINVYPHGLGATRYGSIRVAELYAMGKAIYRIHVRLK